MAKTTISWTDVTDNIIVALGGGWWCRMISPGCAFCYAARTNQSAFFGGNQLAYSGEPPKLKLQEEIIDRWKRQRTPKRHFVASMTDVFGDWVPFDWAVRFLRGMWCAPNQTFQVLTKRPEVMADYVKRWLVLDGLTEVPKNIWLGVSVENQEWANRRIPILISIPARVRFLSVEPMLGPVDLSAAIRYEHTKDDDGIKDKTAQPLVDWVIFGGESGPDARECNVKWIRAGVQQCQSAGVAVFVKQLGLRSVEDIFDCRGGYLGFKGLGLRDQKGGEMSVWPADLRVREFPSV